jgi:hypothetical protein
MIGGFSNNFIPGFCGAAVVFGLAAGGIERLLPRRWMRVYFDLLLFAALILQLTGPQFLKAAIRAPFLPGAQLSVAARARIAAALCPARPVARPRLRRARRRNRPLDRRAKDPVYAPHHPYLMVLAGREPFYTVEPCATGTIRAARRPRRCSRRCARARIRFSFSTANCL